MTESEKRVVPDFKEFLYVLYKKADKEVEKKLSQEAQSYKKEIDVMSKERAMKKWKQSLSYYYLHPKKFKFGLRDLK